MSIPDFLLIILALIPAAVLFVYIYKKDRCEKEPMGLLLLLFGCGALMCLPAAGLEIGLGKVIDAIFSAFTVEVDNELYFVSTRSYYAYQLVDNFIGIALIEEGLKWLVLFLITRKNKNFNSLFDGMIYAVCVSLGFAAFENIGYALSGGLGVVLLRAVCSVPGHMFDAVFMGYYYTEWHFNKRTVEIENILYRNNQITTKYAPGLGDDKALFKSLVFPVLIHGTYDFLLSIDPSSTFGVIVTTVLFIGFLVFLYIISFKKIRKLSNIDTSDTFAAVTLLSKYHPELTELIARIYGGNAAGGPSSAPSAGTTNDTYAPSRPAASPTVHDYRGVFPQFDGRVEEVFAVSGQKVLKGSMLFRIRTPSNMLFPVYSPYSGTVQRINCSKYDTVTTKNIICVIDTAQ